MEQINDNDGLEHSGISGGRINYFPKIKNAHIDSLDISTNSVFYTLPIGPPKGRFIIFSVPSGVNFAVEADAAAVFPSGDVSNGTASFLNPGQLDCKGATTLGIIADQSPTISLIVYGE